MIYKLNNIFEGFINRTKNINNDPADVSNSVFSNNTTNNIDISNIESTDDLQRVKKTLINCLRNFNIKVPDEEYSSIPGSVCFLIKQFYKGSRKSPRYYLYINIYTFADAEISLQIRKITRENIFKGFIYDKCSLNIDVMAVDIGPSFWGKHIKKYETTSEFILFCRFLVSKKFGKMMNYFPEFLNKMKTEFKIPDEDLYYIHFLYFLKIMKNNGFNIQYNDTNINKIENIFDYKKYIDDNVK